MVNLEEKLQLAKEVGAHSYADKIETEKEIKSLVGIKFQKIEDDNYIKSKLCRGFIFDFSRGLFGASMIGILLLGLFGWILVKEQILSNIVLFSSMLTVAIFGFSSALRRPELESTSLSSWNGQLPYGALLATKEAKEIGMSDFEIYYPCTAKHKRLKRDPMVVGKLYKKYDEELRQKNIKRDAEGLKRSHYNEFDAFNIASRWHQPTLIGRFEVFSWDDGKVYD